MMKVAVFALLFSTVALAAQVNLNDGDSITLEANTQTTVTCGNSVNCNQQLSAFQALLKSCEESNTGGNCIKQMWPSFKSKNPTCVAMATQTCLDACQENNTGGQCATFCQ